MPKNKNAAFAKSMGLIIRGLREKKYPGHGGQIRCAADFAVSQSEWSRWERGIKAPAAATQRKLADFFGITIGELWGERVQEGVGGTVIGSAPNEQELLRLYQLGFDIQAQVGLFVMRAAVDANTYLRAVTTMEVIRRTLGMTGVDVAADAAAGREPLVEPVGGGA